MNLANKRRAMLISLGLLMLAITYFLLGGNPLVTIVGLVIVAGVTAIAIHYFKDVY